MTRQDATIFVAAVIIAGNLGRRSCASEGNADKGPSLCESAGILIDPFVHCHSVIATSVFVHQTMWTSTSIARKSS